MYYIVAHFVTKHDNTVEHQNSLYVGEVYIIFLILQQYNKFCIDFITVLIQRYRFRKPFFFSGEEKLRIPNHTNCMAINFLFYFYVWYYTFFAL